MQIKRTEPKIKKERVAVYVSLGLAFAAIAAIVPVMSTTAFAEEPDCWGALTSGAATEDGQENIGAHASDPEPGDADRETPRAGLANALNRDNLQTPRLPDHPSEVGDTLVGCP
ncbi:MAG TPA: hypothetical protein VFR94_25725 [Nitrososphaeraceae archaeon]|jgi:hypothetical protein|nr:hypothetical protein [Nitrososphaeraceae archaeon]